MAHWLENPLLLQGVFLAFSALLLAAFAITALRNRGIRLAEAILPKITRDARTQVILQEPADPGPVVVVPPKSPNPEPQPQAPDKPKSAPLVPARKVVQKDRVEFFVIAPASVPPNYPFYANVNILFFEPPPRSSKDQLSPKRYETIVAEILKDSPIGLALSVDNSFLRADSQFQALRWEQRHLIAPFRLRALSVETRTTLDSALWILLGAMPIGRIDFTTVIDPELSGEKDQTKFSPDAAVAGYVKSRLKNPPAFSETLAVRIRKAFVCYAHADWYRVGILCRALERAGIECWIDAIKMKAQPHWLDQVEHFLTQADTVYLFWSTNATSESVGSEHVKIQEEMKRRKVNRLQRWTSCSCHLRKLALLLPNGRSSPMTTTRAGTYS